MRIQRQEFWGFGSTLVITVVLACLTGLNVFDRAQGLDIDIYHALRGFAATPTGSQTPPAVAVVALDEATYTSQPFVGLPRVMWTPQIATVQDALLGGGAKVVGWDLILPTTAAAYLADKQYDRPLLKSLSGGGREGRVVLGMTQVGKTTIQPNRLFLFAAGGVKNLRALDVMPGVDGVVRSVPSFIKTKRSDGSVDYQTSMALELAARLSGKTPTRLAGGGLRLGDKTVRGVSDDRIFVNFAATTRLMPTYSFKDLWDCAEAGKSGFFQENFAGKAVLFGLVLDVEDRKLSSNRLTTDGQPPGPVVACSEDPAESNAPAARRATIPGVYIIASAVNNIINAEALQRYTRIEGVVLSVPLILFAAVAAMSAGPITGAVAGVVAALVWTVIGTYWFGDARVLPLVMPDAMAVLAFSAIMGLRYVVLERQGRFLRQAFGSYVSPALVEELVRSPERLKLGGERRELSVLFTDLAGFTGLVEQSDPVQFASLLNAYLDRLIEIAKRNGGTIDKVIGDSLVVIFSAPVDQKDHAELAVACAIEMDKAAEEFAQTQNAAGIGFGHTRIGVHSGSAVVGNFGGSGFFDYTVIGDTMNTASRLESANRHFGTRVAVSGDTVQRQSAFSGRLIGHFILKGKADAIAVHTPSGRETSSALAESYASAYALLDGDPKQALQAFETLSRSYPEDPLVRFHLERLRSGETGSIIRLTEK